jgi:plasmid maintenance system antidote protein VapI
MSKDIEQRLREAIVKSELNREKISQLAGVNKGSLSLFVNGKRTLTLPIAARIAKVLGLDLVKRTEAGGK